MFAFHIPRHMTKWRGTSSFNIKAWQLSITPQHATSRSLLQHHSGRSYTAESFKTFAEQNPILLRDSCQCSTCIDISTQQRDFKYADIPSNISVKTIEPDPATKTFKVTYNNDTSPSHISIFQQSKLTQLLDNVPTGLNVPRTMSIWDKSSFSSETKPVDYTSLLEDLSTLSQTLDLIQSHGLVFVENIPEDETAVMSMVTRLTGLFRNTFYGQSWDVRSVPAAKNVAYTSKYLGFHMDLLYMKEPPGLQLLHCLQNSCSGGESEFADTFKAVDILRQENPKYVDGLTQSKIRYGYDNDGFFYSDEKPVIKLKTGGQHLPEAKLQGVGDPDFMQSVEAVYWSPPFINSITGAAHDGDVKEFIEASKAFAEILERDELKYETKLPAGTCAVFDNLRVVHARKEFDMNSGKRWLKGIYGDRQDLLSMWLKHCKK